jgi:hypothetical protein
VLKRLATASNTPLLILAASIRVVVPNCLKRSILSSSDTRTRRCAMRIWLMCPLESMWSIIKRRIRGFEGVNGGSGNGAPELLTPRTVVFFDCESKGIGTKSYMHRLVPEIIVVDSIL